jgi:hypothetical protein
MHKFMSILFIFFSSVAYAERWFDLGSTDEVKMALDLETISFQNGYVKAWEKNTIYNDITKDGLTVGDYTKILWKVDCTGKRLGVIRSLSYKKTHVVNGDTGSYAYPVMRDVIPETHGETLLTDACYAWELIKQQEH